MQAIGAAIALPARCTWCAPTARCVVSASPSVPRGGAGFAAEPWQELQPTVASILPSMWSAAFTVAAP